MVALLISNLFLNNLSFKYFWMVLIYAVLATRAADSSQFVAPASQLSAVATGPGPQATFLREQLD